MRIRMRYPGSAVRIYAQGQSDADYDYHRMDELRKRLQKHHEYLHSIGTPHIHLQLLSMMLERQRSRDLPESDGY